MIYHRKRLILSNLSANSERLTHLIRLRRWKLELKLAMQNRQVQLDCDDEDDLDGLGQISFLPGDMESLTPKERRRLQKENKNMPAYLFMTESEK